MGKRIEVLISGFGGQGVVRLGQILAQTSVNENLYTTMLVSHGTETRGGYVRAQVVVSDEQVDSPVCENPDFLVAMSKAAYTRFNSLVNQGTILYEPYYVEVDKSLGCKHAAVKAREVAINELGREIYANVIMLGYLTKHLEGTLSKKEVLKVMLQKIPKFHAENKQAFELGYNMAQQQ